MHIGIAVHFGCAGNQHFGADTFRQTEHIDRTNCIRFDRFHPIEHVVWRRRRTRQMIDFVDFDEQWIHNVMMNQFEIFVTQPMFHVTLATGEKIVGDNDFMALHHQIVNQMRSHETSATRNLFYVNDKRNGTRENICVTKCQIIIRLTKIRFRFL